MILSFINPYIALNFDIIPKKHSEPFSISTLICESILAERAYREYHIFINDNSTISYLIGLDMVYFNFF